MKKVLCILLAAILLFAFGCGDNKPPEPEPFDAPGQISAITGTLGIPFVLTESLNPITTQSKLNADMLTLVFDGLFELSPGFDVVKNLCESYEIEDKTLTCTIKDQVIMHDGSTLTAADVVYSYDMAMASSPYTSRFDMISRVKATSSKRVEFTLKYPYADIITLLDLPIIKKNSDKSVMPIGSGGYKLASVAGQTTLEVFAENHKGLLYPADVKLVDIADTAAFIYEFESTNISLANIDITDTSPIGLKGNLEHFNYTTTVFHYLGINMKTPVLQDPLVRRALACATNRQQLSASVFLGHFETSTLTLPPETQGVEESLFNKNWYNIDTAKALFTQAGISDTDGDGFLDNAGKRVVLKLLVNQENSFKLAACNTLSIELAKLGVEVTVTALPFADFTKALKAGSFDLYYGEVALNPDFNPQSILGTGQGLNFGGYSDRQLDDLLDANIHTKTPQSQREFFEYFCKESPIIPLGFKRNTVVAHKDTYPRVMPTYKTTYYGLDRY